MKRSLQYGTIPDNTRRCSKFVMVLHISDVLQYTGSLTHGKAEGTGTFEFTNGTKYEGEFRMGEFHGCGTLVLSSGRFEGKWEQGKVVKGHYIFEDGLEFSEKNWGYCNDQDRRYWKEVKESRSITKER